MPIFENLPGVFLEMLDGNLAISNESTGPSVVILGTGTSGPSNRLVKITKPSFAVNVFGEGSISYAARESDADNLWAYRIGGTPAIVTNIGNTDKTEGKGITVESVQYDDEAGDNLFLSWDEDAQRLKVWDVDGNLLYDNNPGGVPIDSGLVRVYGDTDGVTGTSFGTSSVGVQMSLLDEGLSGGVEGVEYQAGTDGTNLTGRQLYEALQEAYRDLETSSGKIFVVPDIVLDFPNIDDNEDIASVTSDFLGWFKETYDEDTGEYTYEWSSATTKPTGYHSVNFVFQFCRFLYNLTSNENSCIGTVGVLPPAGFSSKKDLAVWLGKAPVLDPVTGLVTTNGTGLLGNKFMAGTTSRAKGFFLTSNEELDGDVVNDSNGYPIDIGKHVSVVAGFARFLNGGTTSPFGYISNAAVAYASKISNLSPKSAPTNKVLPTASTTALQLKKSQLNALTAAGYVTLQQDLDRVLVVDAPTAATQDYKRLTTVRIAFEAVDRVRRVLKPYVGEGGGSTMRQSAQTTAERELAQMIQDQSLRAADVKLSATRAQEIAGEVDAELILLPAYEVRRIVLKTSVRA